MTKKTEIIERPAPELTQEEYDRLRSLDEMTLKSVNDDTTIASAAAARFDVKRVEEKFKDTDFAKFFLLSSLGLNSNDIAAMMGVSAAKFRSALERGADDIAHGRLTKAAVLTMQHNRGRTNMKTSITTALLSQAKAGNVRAAGLLLDRYFPPTAAETGEISDVEAKNQFSQIMERFEDQFRAAAERAKKAAGKPPTIEAEATDTSNNE